MRFPRPYGLTIVAMFAMVLPAGTALAQGYSGNWPITITRSQHSNGTYCLTLTDGGSLGWPHSGQAVLTTKSNKYYGTFQVINHDLVATIEEPGYGQNAGAVFEGRASHGSI